MSKHNILSTREAVQYNPNPEILRYILGDKKFDDTVLRGLKVLDWGCGRGRMVAYLLKEGIDAYGVDVDYETIKNSKIYFSEAGLDSDKYLHVMRSENQTNFPDGFFDVIISDNVLEHIPDLNTAMTEIMRITKPGGYGFHLFPSRYTLREGHLFMPIIHWLPKNNLRHAAIRLFTALGVEPRWPELTGKTSREKAQIYFDYSCSKTFYRHPRRIIEICARAGMQARLVAIDHPRMKRFEKFWGTDHSLLRRFANYMVSELKTMELYVERQKFPDGKED